MMATSASRGSFWRRWTPLFGAGMLGVASMLPQTVRAIRDIAQVPEASVPLVTAASLLQTSVLVGGVVAIGVALAPKLGLRSYLAEKFAEDHSFWASLRPEIPLAIAGGLVSVTGVVLLDLAFRPFVGNVFQDASAIAQNQVLFRIGGILYGGITEELMMRWGLMTLLAWIGWRLFQRDTGRPSPVIMWTSLALAAVLFGIGHLPATAMLTALTPAIVARAVVLNSFAGIIFGWLYWRRSLEAAMVAHATFHAALLVVGLITG
jgi:hypothetical protein